MNAEMIVKALKHCAKHNCEGCPYNGPSNFTGDCIDREEVLLIAADLIKSLQKQLNDMTDTARQNSCQIPARGDGGSGRYLLR